MYIHTEEIYNTKSAEIVVPIILDLFKPKCVLDVGCGTGTWLSVFEKLGVTDVQGIDGDYVDRFKLHVDTTKFLPHDLTKGFSLGRKFDIVLCLEVGEHLPQASSELLIKSLISHADNVIFSAAIPGQGGQNHLNEQWPSYWSDLFLNFGYNRFDLIRPLIWTNNKVDIWYKQNIFIYSKSSLSQDKRSLTPEIHPDLWSAKIELLESLHYEVSMFDKGGAGIKRSFKGLIHSVANRIKKCVPH